LERLLFDRGCMVFRADAESEVVREALVRLGGLVIVSESRGAASVSAGSETRTVETPSAAALERALEEMQVFSENSWTESGGI
jgi:hypothetical protein